MQLRADNLIVRYDGSEAAVLSNVSFAVESGEKVALLGDNGAGKSTLLLTLAGVLEPVSGGVILDGLVVKRENLHGMRQKIGMVFQNPDDQLFMSTVHEDVAFGPRSYGSAEEKIEQCMDKVFSRLGILHLKNRMTHRLSGGEKRLAALAGILIMEPSVLLMDEPFSFLDLRSRRRLEEILDTLPQTSLIATHDLEVAERLCTRAIVLKEGRVHADGPIGAIITRLKSMSITCR
ncbi:MAG: energy-coupling factor ABC transporter ATP-binding protein [Synergistaceae bacterium]|nr:energy-coupling factor ABC transporter ATP-binding protein [Synergistaceae bacterium]